MPKIPSPQTQSWSGQYLGRYKGDFVQSFGIDLESQPGSLLTTPGMEVLLNRNTIDYGIPTAFIYTDADTTAKWWIGTKRVGSSIKPMLVDSGSQVFIQDAMANTPPADKDVLDMIVHQKNNNNDRLVVARTISATTGTLDILNSASNNNVWLQNWWGTTLAQGRTLSANLLLAKLNTVLAVCDKNLVHSIDANDTVVDSALVVDTDYTIIGAQNTVDRFWFAYSGSKVTGTGRGAIVEWDGYSLTYNYLHPLEGVPVIGFSIKNVPHYILDNGQMVRYNGLGFANIENVTFPVFENRAFFSTSDFVSNHSVSVEGGIAYINMPTSTNSEKMRGGVWVFNSYTGNLYHSYKHRNDNQYGSSYATVSGAIAKTSDAYKFMLGFGSIKDDKTTVVTDYVISRVGATAAYSSSYFITPAIPSNEIEDYFYNIWLKFGKMSGTLPKIIVKYRVSDGYAVNGDQYLRVPVSKAITWTAANKFTVASAAGLKVGDEVEITGGPNSGACFHISDITSLTITIDETPVYTYGANYVGYAIFDDWIKIDDNNKNPITSITKYFESLVSGSAEKAVGPSIQFKIELRGDNVQEIRQLIIDQKVHTQSNL